MEALRTTSLDSGLEDGGLGAEGGDNGTASGFQPEFHFRGFMQLKNDDKSGTILCGHLSQLARMVPSFNLVGYSQLSLIHI